MITAKGGIITYISRSSPKICINLILMKGLGVMTDACNIAKILGYL